MGSHNSTSSTHPKRSYPSRFVWSFSPNDICKPSPHPTSCSIQRHTRPYSRSSLLCINGLNRPDLGLEKRRRDLQTHPRPSLIPRRRIEPLSLFPHFRCSRRPTLHLGPKNRGSGALIRTKRLRSDRHPTRRQQSTFRLRRTREST